MKTVLLIDDDRDFSRVAASYLRAAGWNVLQAENGESGLDLARQHRPEAIICDLLMPRVNGYQVCRALRSEGDRVGRPHIIVTTGSHYSADRTNALEAGADDFLVKPILARDLICVLAGAPGNSLLGLAHEKAAIRSDVVAGVTRVGERHGPVRPRQWLVAKMLRGFSGLFGAPKRQAFPPVTKITSEPLQPKGQHPRRVGSNEGIASRFAQLPTSSCRIVIADDDSKYLETVRNWLGPQGYQIFLAGDGEEALGIIKAQKPDLILLDVGMPKLNGFEACRRVRSDPSIPFIPIVIVSGSSELGDIVTGLDAGADEYLTKPVSETALLARVRSMLRIKTMHDTIQEQAINLAQWNQNLEGRVAQQVSELERLGRLKRFLAPQLARLVVTSGDEKILESHRREITVVFCDLRGFSAFSEGAEPEEVMRVLGDYHSAVGELIFRYEGTLERFAGDGLMVFFNDPMPCADPAIRATRMAVEMRQRVEDLASGWRKRGHELGFGVGIAMGYATLGQIGFEGRLDYAAIGPVTNLGSRLCDEAKSGQILISQRVYAAVEALVTAETVGEFTLKGFQRPVTAYNILGFRAEA